MKKLTLVLFAALMLQLSMVSAAFAKDTLNNGETLSAGQQLTSSNGAYFLKMQTDGNLVLYTASGQSRWSTSTNKATIRIYDPFCGCYRVRIPDKLVLENGLLNIKIVAHTVWTADSAGWSFGRHPAGTNLFANVLVVQNDGNVVLYNTSSGSWYPVWASDTGVGGP
ncbi:MULTISPECIES: hypothetical protein [Paenibacillus]|uniref:hypothetical protein n=1 Tax=Paenibacillus TaxID=44249 RepID=UPI0022B872DA|nr:hypothetical protein [Paenibacillus caseinilyticus]MCZ8523205.1 hypothetical protein [Paenibacillus caseinilyticus]